MQLITAIRIVLADQAAGGPEIYDPETDSVPDQIAHVRDILRLPEDGYVMGAYPIDDDGSEIAIAYRIVLTSSPQELHDAFQTMRDDAQD